MQIKKRTLIIVSIISAIVLITVSITGYCYYQHYKSEKKKTELREEVEKAIDREYKNLKLDYDFYVKQLTDYSYPSDLREKYLRQLNELLGSCRYKLWSFKWDYENNHKEDLALLKIKASQNVYNKIVGL